MFVMYADGSGNVTVSPRLGRGHYEPQSDKDEDFELLEGSGVDGYRMTANILCRNCSKWIGGGMDFKKESGLWIWAALPGLPLASHDEREGLRMHKQHGVFMWPYGEAKGGKDEANPFLNASIAQVTLGVAGSLPPPPVHWEPTDKFPIAHGTVASFALLVLFPLGAILIRVTAERRLVWVHAGIQAVAYFMLFAAMAMGIRMASSRHLFNDKHPVIGIFIVLVLFFQAVDGLLHHAQWMRNEKRRTWLAYVHIWTGRFCILLGMVNGGFGLQLAGVQSKGKWAGYCAVAAVSFICLVVAICYGERKRSIELKARKEKRRKSEAENNTSRFE